MSFLNSFRIFDFCITVVALMANCVALIALTRSRFNLIGYRSFLMSLTAGNLFTCLLGITIMAYDASVFSSHHRDDLVSGNVTGGSNSALGYNSWLGHESFDDVAALCASSMLRSLKLASFIINLLNLWGMSIDHLLGIVSHVIVLNSQFQIFVLNSQGFPIKYQSVGI